MTIDSDIILLDTEKKWWYEKKTKAEREADQRRRGLRGTYIHGGVKDREEVPSLQTAIQFLQALGFLLSPASFLRRPSFWRCLTGKRRAMRRDPEKENRYLKEYTVWEKNLVTA